MGVRDMAAVHRSAGEAYAAIAGADTVIEVAVRARLAVWRFTHASRGEAAG